MLHIKDLTWGCFVHVIYSCKQPFDMIIAMQTKVLLGKKQVKALLQLMLRAHNFNSR